MLQNLIMTRQQISKNILKSMSDATKPDYDSSTNQQILNYKKKN